MLQTTIPKDIRKYEAKMAGPFTTRQTIFFVIACICAYIAWFLLKNVNACFLFAIPAIAFGWVKVYGQPLEKFIKSAFISNFVSPKQRKYKTKNIYKLAEDDFTPLNEKETKKIKKKYKKEAKKNELYKSYK